MVLYRLLSSQDRRGFSSAVVSLTGPGSVGKMIAGLGVPVISLNRRPGFPDPRLVTGLIRAIQSFRPDLLQTWMYHSDLIGSMAVKFCGSKPVVWGLHHTIAEQQTLKASTLTVARLNAFLSARSPAKIVCCAEATRQSHLRLGYSESKMVVISNGIDPAVFRPDPFARRSVRAEIGVTAQTRLIGLCARLDSLKDHQNFIRAAGILHQSFPNVHFVLWGLGVVPEARELRKWSSSAGVDACIHFLGMREDSPRLMAALDLGCLSSFSEAFPLAVAEIMACGVPCVVTNVGDTARIVGDTGRIVPSRDPVALAEAWAELLGRSPGLRVRLGERARRRIVEHFSLDNMAASYSQLYRDIIDNQELQ